MTDKKVCGYCLEEYSEWDVHLVYYRGCQEAYYQQLADIANRKAPEADEAAANPKDRAGQMKPSLLNVPRVSMYELATAMDDGARKYGRFNWRDHPVKASVYIEAAMRHLNAYFDGEDRASDSGVDHRAHAMACMAILIDAEFNGCLIDDRAPNGKCVSEYFAERVKKAVDGAV